ncbi:uncharacterized protein LOC135693261 [Rhopilema esculentum]|uniref:uncharacterized protein LOC135693261 n=1 Tax=Rhopilema esculentum TaxID=499914 RepID=UPI0031DCD276
MSQSKKRDNVKLEGKQLFRDEDRMSFPRMIARIWGMVVAISYISSGGSLVANATTKDCKIVGIYMVVIGIIIMVIECPCCLLVIHPGNKLCGAMERNFPFWVKGLVYLGLMFTPLILCFSWKTMLTSLTMIILVLLYFFLTCLQGSKRYERLRGEINYEFNKKQDQVNFAYSSFGHASATVNAFQSAARNSKTKTGKSRGSAGKPSQKAHVKKPTTKV